MTKRLNLLPNERIDQPDLNYGINTLPVSLEAQIVQRTLLDHSPRSLSGFRLEVANQGTSPGEFTVWNGVAFDRLGNILQNEDEENTSRSVTLSADGQYFVEVLFASNESDTDARGFWDPTVDNGTDPSGDPRLPGREFAQNVATRLTSDWQIVTPVSTTGFAITTNPSSLNVPVAVIQVSGGVIVGATTVPAQTSLEVSVLVGATALRVLDSRLFPDTFTGTIDAEVITVTSNDRLNGLLQLAVGLAAPHSQGAPVVRTGGSLNQFLVDRTDQSIPTTGSADARPRFFQGWEARGFALSKDPGAAAGAPWLGRSNTQIQTLKDHVDFLAAQIRELKFGSALDSGVGNSQPPGSFPALPHAYHVAGSVSGARETTVSVGDGVASFGDFNSLQSGSFEAAMNAAISSLPTSGGKIFLKNSASPYLTNVGLTLPNKRISLIGENSNVEIRTPNANAAINLDACQSVTFENLKITMDSASTAPSAVTWTAMSGPVFIRNCTIHGMTTTDSSTISIIAAGSQFLAQHNSNGFGFDGDLIRSEFTACTFSAQSAAVSGGRALRTRGLTSTSLVKFSSCSFTASFVSGSSAVELNSGSLGNIFGVVFDNCQFVSPDSTNIFARNVDTLTISNSLSTSTPSGLIDIDSSRHIRITSCGMSQDATFQSINIGSSSNNTDYQIRDCVFQQTSFGSGAAATGIRIANATSVVIDGCTFDTVDSMLTVTSILHLTVSNCTMRTSSSTVGRYGIRFLTTAESVTISGCMIANLQDTTDTRIRGIELDSGMTLALQILVTGCKFISFGTLSTACNVYGVIVSTNASLNLGFTVEACAFQSLTCGSSNDCEGVNIGDLFPVVNILNCVFELIGLNSNHARAIHVFSPSELHVIGNTIVDIGNSSKNFNTAILTENGATTSATLGQIIIAYNNILLVNVSADSSGNGCIGLFASCRSLIIQGNTLEPRNANAEGITIHDNSPFIMDDVVICGNTIGSPGSGGTATIVSGVRLVTNNSGHGRIAITGNAIRDFSSVGVSIDGATSNADTSVTVAGNTIVSDFNGNTRIAIDVEDLSNFTISGNTINYPTSFSQNSTSINVASCLFGSINGNMIFNAECPTTGAIQISGSGDIMVSGNMVRQASAAAGQVAVAASSIPGGRWVYVASNLFTGFTSVPVTGVTSTHARSDIAGNESTNPSALSDICLNMYV